MGKGTAMYAFRNDPDFQRISEEVFQQANACENTNAKSVILLVSSCFDGHDLGMIRFLATAISQVMDAHAAQVASKHVRDLHDRLKNGFDEIMLRYGDNHEGNLEMRCPEMCPKHELEDSHMLDHGQCVKPSGHADSHTAMGHFNGCQWE